MAALQQPALAAGVHPHLLWEQEARARQPQRQAWHLLLELLGQEHPLGLPPFRQR
jgi:hypothetical protein